MTDNPEPVNQRRRRFRISERQLQLLALVAVVIVLVVVFLLRGLLKSSVTGAVGYPAVFFLPLLANSTVVLPVPGFLVVCSGGVVLNPIAVGLLAGAGMALGEITGYLAGFSGSGIAKNSRVYRRIQPWIQRRGWMVVLAFAAIPNPFFDVLGIASGAARMPFWQFLGASWVGKTVMGTTTAFGCAWGYSLFKLLAERLG